MFDKLDEIPSAAPETDETPKTGTEERPRLMKEGEPRPKGFEEPGSGFRWYITHQPTQEEVIRRMEDFINRKDEFIAAIRKSQN